MHKKPIRVHSFRSKECFKEGTFVWVEGVLLGRAHSFRSKECSKEGTFLREKLVLLRRAHSFMSKECAQRKPMRAHGTSLKAKG